MPRPLFTPGKDPVPIVQVAGCAPGLVWTGVENLVPSRIRSPDRPARSQSLYQLRYPALSLFSTLMKVRYLLQYMTKVFPNSHLKKVCHLIITFKVRHSV